MKSNMQHNWGSLTGFIIVILVIQGTGSMVTMKEIPHWYATLEKATWNPPNEVFGPIWTILYILIASSGWRLWIKMPGMTIVERLKNPVMRYYFVQLLFNAVWSPLFFGLHATALALTDLLLTIIFLTLTMHVVRPVDRTAFYFFIPYWLWLVYAASLNAAIVYLN